MITLQDRYWASISGHDANLSYREATVAYDGIIGRCPNNVI